jgi:hypothetical protein
VTLTSFDSGGLRTTQAFTLTVTTPAECSPVNFATATSFAVGRGPHSVAVGDFNGDGKQDLVTANFTNTVTILLGDGSGGFVRQSGNFAAGAQSVSVAVGDFNGDGKQDLVTANSGSDNVSVLLGDGTGNFGLPTNFGVGSHPLSVALGDFNGDGRLDLVTANENTANVTILLGDGAGGFGVASNFAAGANPFSLAVGDFDGDTKQDLVVTNGGSNSISILMGNGLGGFRPANNFVISANANSDPESVAVGDFNGDGKQDIATANKNSGDVSVLLGAGNGSFGAADNLSVGVGGHPASIVVGDFNSDGKQDLNAESGVNIESDRVVVLLGDGLGHFGAAVAFSVGSFPDSISVGDFNGDGHQDVVTGNAADNNVSVLLAQCMSP